MGTDVPDFTDAITLQTTPTAHPTAPDSPDWSPTVALTETPTLTPMAKDRPDWTNTVTAAPGTTLGAGPVMNVSLTWSTTTGVGAHPLTTYFTQSAVLPASTTETVLHTLSFSVTMPPMYLHAATYPTGITGQPTVRLGVSLWLFASQWSGKTLTLETLTLYAWDPTDSKSPQTATGTTGTGTHWASMNLLPTRTASVYGTALWFLTPTATPRATLGPNLFGQKSGTRATVKFKKAAGTALFTIASWYSREFAGSQAHRGGIGVTAAHQLAAGVRFTMYVT